MAVYEVFLTCTKSHLSLHRHLEVSLEVVEETLLILQENSFDFFLELGAPVSRWVCSQFLISSRGFDSSICGWKNKFSIFLGDISLPFCIESFGVDF